MRTIFHIDFNSYFATVEQQANPRLRGKPIGVTGGDRMQRTVVGAASVEAKKYGVKTGMSIPEALRFCPNLILVKGDSDKYLECTKRFLNILKDYSDKLEVFSIDECFLEIRHADRGPDYIRLATSIKERIKTGVGEWITVSIGISYNKLMAKLAGSLYKPDGLVVIADEQAAQMVLNQVGLDEVCGIGGRIKKRLENMGIFTFKQLRKVPLSNLVASFKDYYGQVLYNYARGVDYSEVVPFFEKEEVKSVGHRHTLDHDTASLAEIRKLLLKLSELVARRLRAKKLIGKTVHLWYRSAHFGGGRQTTIADTSDGLEIFQAGWRVFGQIWDHEPVRMVGVAVSNLKPLTLQNLTLLEEGRRAEKVVLALDKVNDRFGEFTLQRAALLEGAKITRKPNPFLSDRRFRL